MQTLNRWFTQLLYILFTPFRRMGGGLLALALPTKGKRILYVVSLYRAMHKEGLSREDLIRLNQELRLVTKTDALSFPAVISELLAVKMRNDVAKLDPCQDCYQPAVGSIINRAPYWLVYGDRAGMIKDTARLLNLFNRERQLPVVA